MKYVAIKVEGLNYYLWFETVNVIECEDRFGGVKGWGKGGAYIDQFTCSKSQIVSRISTNELGY